MAQLAAGKTDRYRAICSRLWGRFGKTVSFAVAQRVGYAIVASPLVASKVPAAKLEVVAAGTAAFGPALVRAGKWEDAIREFEQPAIPTIGARKSWSLLFQAMAHHRLGHAARVREDFDKAKRGFEVAGRDKHTIPTWAQRIEFQTVLREAEALLKDGARVTSLFKARDRWRRHGLHLFAPYRSYPAGNSPPVGAIGFAEASLQSAFPPGHVEIIN